MRRLFFGCLLVLFEAVGELRVAFELGTFCQADSPFLSLDGLGDVAGIEVGLGERVSNRRVLFVGQFVGAPSDFDGELEQLGAGLDSGRRIDDGPREPV